MTTTVNPEALVAVATSLNLQVTRQSRFYRIERPGDVRRIYVPTGKVVREVHLSHFETCPPAAVPFRETEKRKMPTKQVRFELDSRPLLGGLLGSPPDMGSDGSRGVKQC
jgi:hypothetical protein